MNPVGFQNGTPISAKWLAIIVVTALTVRIVLMVIVQSWEFNDQWLYGWEMGRIGQWLAEGRGFTLDGEFPTARFPPAYPHIVAIIFWSFGIYSTSSAVVIFLFQSTCAAMSAALMALLGAQLFGRGAGLVAGFAWTVYPISLLYSIDRIWYCELSILLLLAAITVTVRSEPTNRQVFYLGAISGLAILVDTTLAVYLFLLSVWWFITRLDRLSKMTTAFMVWAVTVAIVISPWMVRNWYVFDAPMWGKSSIGIELFVGNNNFSMRLPYRDRQKKAFETLDPEELANYQNQSEKVFFDYLEDKGRDWIRNHPVEFAEKIAVRIEQFWFFGFHRKVYSFGLLVVALIGLWRARARWWQLMPIWAFPIIYPLPYYLTYAANLRYHYPTEPFILLLAASTLSLWFERRSLSLARAANQRPAAETQRSSS